MLKLKCCPRSELISRIQGKRIVCFGAGRLFAHFLEYYKNEENADIACVIDNDETLSGTEVYGYPVLSVEQFRKKNADNYVIVITNQFQCCDMVRQLDGIPSFDGVECYLDIFNIRVAASSSPYPLQTGNRIPRRIHYFWFGGGAIPEHLQQYIDGWKRWCPDYEIIQWNESNYDVKKNRYMYQAYQSRKYGFVPDYARLDVIYRYGGIYLDADVEMVKSWDALLGEEMFCGFESPSKVNFGHGFGAVKGHPMLKRLMESYEDRDFVVNGVIDYTPSPFYQSQILKQEGFRLDGTFQRKNGVTVFPNDVFAPGMGMLFEQCLTGNTFSIHHFEGSWVKNGEKVKKWREELAELYEKRIRKLQ